MLHWGGRHWVVLTRLDGDRARLADPALGARTCSRAQLAEEWSGYAALPTPTARLADAPRQRIDLAWMRPAARPLVRAVPAALLLGLIASALQLAIPILTGVVIDDAISDRDYGLLHLVTIAMLGALVLGVGASLLQRLILARVAVRVDGDALDLLTQRLLRLPLDYFQTRTSVDIERRLAGMRQIRKILVESGVRSIGALTQLVAIVVLMFVYSWELALAFLAGLPLYGLLLRFSRTRLRPAFASLEESFSRYTARQIDSIKGIETVKVMGAERGLRDLLVREFARLQDRLYRTDLTVMVYDALIQAATLGLYAALLWVGALQVLAGDISIGDLVVYNTLILLANPALLTLLGFWESFSTRASCSTGCRTSSTPRPSRARTPARCVPSSDSAAACGCAASASPIPRAPTGRSSRTSRSTSSRARRSRSSGGRARASPRSRNASPASWFRAAARSSSTASSCAT